MEDLEILETNRRTTQNNLKDDGIERTFLFQGDEFETTFRRYLVEIGKKTQYWDVKKARTSNSLYGQLVMVGEANGQLTESTITLVVTGEGLERRYVVMEAVSLQAQEEKINKKQSQSTLKSP